MRPPCRRPSPDPASAAAGALDVSGAFASAFLPVGIAVSTKIRSAQTIGVASPEPGSLTFHFTSSVSLQVTGGSANGAAPVASGPRHCGQNWFTSEGIPPALAIEAVNSPTALAIKYMNFIVWPG